MKLLLNEINFIKNKVLGLKTCKQLQNKILNMLSIQIKKYHQKFSIKQIEGNN